MYGNAHVCMYKHLYAKCISVLGFQERTRFTPAAMDVVAVNTPERLFSLFATLSGLIMSLLGNYEGLGFTGFRGLAV